MNASEVIDRFRRMSAANDMVHKANIRSLCDVLEGQIAPEPAGSEWQWPEWLKAPWIAMDADERWWCFVAEPRIGSVGWWPPDRSILEAVVLPETWSHKFDFTPPPCTDWRESKRQNPRLAPAAEEPKPARPAMLLATFCAKGNNWLWLMRTGNKQRPWTSARDISYAPIDIVAIDEQLSDPAAVALYKSELAEAAT